VVVKNILIIFFIFFNLFFLIGDETSDKKTIGNKWFSPQSFFILHTAEAGVSGSKDYFTEYFSFIYTFKSKNRHSFSIRNYHIGYGPGLFSGNLKYFNFAFMVGFEYLYKIFGYDEGIFMFMDVGACNNGFAINTGLGIGSRSKNGFEFNISFLQNVMLFSRMDFYFLVFNFLTLRGKIRFDFKYNNMNIEIFTFLFGGYFGFSVKEYFRIEFGGGLTVNDYAYYSGCGSIILGLKIR